MSRAHSIDVRSMDGIAGRGKSSLASALAGLVTACLLLAACGPGPIAQPPAGAPDAQPGADGGGLDGAGGGSFTFEADDRGTASPAVALKLEKWEGESAWLTIVGRGIPKLHGVAFRLSFSPAALVIEKSEAGAVWTQSGTVSRFALRPEGELWAGLAHLGPHALAASSEVVLARVKVRPKGSATVEIRFRPAHNLVLDAKGATVKTAWLGGRLKHR